MALLLLLIYTPVGVCLMLMRIFIGVHVFLVSCAIPESFVRRQVSTTMVYSQHCATLYTVNIHLSLFARRFVVRVMCSVLGMHVRQRNPRSRDKNTKIYVCNHVTNFDHNIINLLSPFSTVSVQLSPF